MVKAGVAEEWGNGSGNSLHVKQRKPTSTFST